MNLDVFGGRKFVMALGCQVVTGLLQWFGKLDPAGSTYALVIVGTVGAFIAGNVMQKRVEAGKG